MQSNTFSSKILSLELGVSTGVLGTNVQLITHLIPGAGAGSLPTWLQQRLLSE